MPIIWGSRLSIYQLLLSMVIPQHDDISKSRSWRGSKDGTSDDNDSAPNISIRTDSNHHTILILPPNYSAMNKPGGAHPVSTQGAIQCSLHCSVLVKHCICMLKRVLHWVLVGYRFVSCKDHLCLMKEGYQYWGWDLSYTIVVNL